MAKTILVAAVMIAFAASAGCANVLPPRPYSEGRLVRTAYIEIAGTPEEIAAIKANAAERVWAVDCEGTAGDQATLRLRFPPGTSQATIEGYFADLTQPRGSKNQMVYAGMPRSKGCVTLP